MGCFILSCTAFSVCLIVHEETVQRYKRAAGGRGWYAILQKKQKTQMMTFRSQ